MTSKIELEESFDLCEWSFIHQSHIIPNFPESLISLIMAYITTAYIYVIINGIPTRHFISCRGIRKSDRYLHGCSLSARSLSLETYKSCYQRDALETY